MEKRRDERHLLSNYSLEELEEKIGLEEQLEKGDIDSGINVMDNEEEIIEMEKLRLKQIQMNMANQEAEFKEEQDELKMQQSTILKQRNKLEVERDNIAEQLEKELHEDAKPPADSSGSEGDVAKEQRQLEESKRHLEKIESEIKEYENEINLLARQEQELLNNYREREREISKERKRLEQEEEANQKRLEKIRKERKRIEGEIKSEQLLASKRGEAKREVTNRRALIEDDIRIELERERQLKAKASELVARNKQLEEIQKQEAVNKNRSTSDSQKSVISENGSAYNEQPNQEKQSETSRVNRLDTMPGGVASFLKDRNEMIDRRDYEDIEEELYQDDVSQGNGLIGRLKKIFK